MLSLPTSTAPARLELRDGGAVVGRHPALRDLASRRWSRRPAVTNRSFSATGTPASRPGSSPRAILSSTARACASAPRRRAGRSSRARRRRRRCAEIRLGRPRGAETAARESPRQLGDAALRRPTRHSPTSMIFGTSKKRVVRARRVGERVLDGELRLERLETSSRSGSSSGTACVIGSTPVDVELRRASPCSRGWRRARASSWRDLLVAELEPRQQRRLPHVVGGDLVGIGARKTSTSLARAATACAAAAARARRRGPTSRR